MLLRPMAFPHNVSCSQTLDHLQEPSQRSLGLKALEKCVDRCSLSLSLSLSPSPDGLRPSRWEVYSSLSYLGQMVCWKTEGRAHQIVRHWVRPDIFSVAAYASAS